MTRCECCCLLPHLSPSHGAAHTGALLGESSSRRSFVHRRHHPSNQQTTLHSELLELWASFHYPGGGEGGYFRSFWLTSRTPDRSDVLYLSRASVLLKSSRKAFGKWEATLGRCLSHSSTFVSTSQDTRTPDFLFVRGGDVRHTPPRLDAMHRVVWRLSCQSQSAVKKQKHLVCTEKPLVPLFVLLLKILTFWKVLIGRRPSLSLAAANVCSYLSSLLFFWVFFRAAWSSRLYCTLELGKMDEQDLRV